MLVSVKKVVLDKLLSASKSVTIIREEYMSELLAVCNSITVIQTFANKSDIAPVVYSMFASDCHESEVVKWLDDQLSTNQKGKLNGANIFDKIISISRKSKYSPSYGSDEIYSSYVASLKSENVTKVEEVA